MTTIARITGILRQSVSAELFNELIRIYPEGQERHAFWAFLPVDDPRTVAIMQHLERAGIRPHRNRSIPRDKSKEFALDFERRYDDLDLKNSSYLEPSPRNEAWGLFRDDATGFVKLNVQQVDNSLDFAFAFFSRYVIPQRVKQLIESAGLRHVMFRPTVLYDRDARDEGRAEVIPWEDWGPPWWEITSDYLLPPVSPSMDLRDRNGAAVLPGDPAVHYVRREGLYLWPELRYRASDLAKAEPFDLAGTMEHFGGELRREDRTLVASQRFYRFFSDRGLKTDWIPVQVEDDRCSETTKA